MRVVSDCIALAKSDPTTRAVETCDPVILEASRNIYVELTEAQQTLLDVFAATRSCRVSRFSDLR